MRKREQTLETSLQLVLKQGSKGPLTLEQLVHILSRQGRYLVLIALSLPFCLPIQLPGLSIPFGCVIAFLGIRIALSRPLWLPRVILSKKIRPHTIRKITRRGLSLLRTIRRWIHPRLNGICQIAKMRFISGFTFLALGMFLALPLPIPLTNLAAAWPILLIAWGTIEQDGLLILVGYSLCLITLLLLVFFAWSMIGLSV